MKIWNRKVGEGALYDVGSLSDAPSGNGVTKWLIGVGLALLPFCYGVHSVLEKQTLFFGKGASLHVYGTTAVAMGVAYIALGAFMHFHWFWGSIQRFQSGSETGKVASLLVFLMTFLFAIYRILLTFIP